MARHVWVWVLVVLLGACTEEKALTVTGVEPSKGRYVGGDPVHIKGTGFRSGGQLSVEVYFGGRKAQNCSINSNTEISCETPAGDKDTQVDVEVQFADARSKKLVKAYRYFDPIETAPTLDQLTPSKR